MPVTPHVGQGTQLLKTLVDTSETATNIKFFPAGGSNDPTKVYATLQIVQTINQMMGKDRFYKQMAGFLINYFLSSTSSGYSCWHFDMNKYDGDYWSQKQQSTDFKNCKGEEEEKFLIIKDQLVNDINSNSIRWTSIVPKCILKDPSANCTFLEDQMESTENSSIH